MKIKLRASLVAQLVKNPPAMQETLVKLTTWQYVKCLYTTEWK